MPVPTLITELSTTAASNYPAGTDSPATLDDVQRAHGAFIAQIRDGVQVTNASAKTTPVDADYLPINDSAASNLIKKVTWVNVKAALKTYFDTLYAAVGSFAASGANADITSLTALTAGGLPNNSVLTADIADAQITPAKLTGAQTGSAPIYGCRAWVNFTGATGSIGAGGNVSSVTRTTTGAYTVNLTTALPDTNYSIIALCNGSVGNTICGYENTAVARTTSKFGICFNSGGVAFDPATISVHVMR